MESYLNNPRASRDDFVLYVFVENEELIAFRTVLPDHIVFQGEKRTFGWCSGTYVKPAYRGQKISVSLLNEVMKDWEGHLMFTNYAQASEYCYLNTHAFKILKVRTGLRFYFYPDFNKIYRLRKNYHRIKLILPLLSIATCIVSFLKSSLCLKTGTRDRFIELNGLDQECKNHLKKSPATFFNRKASELDWIMRYPWVTDESCDGFTYPFSYSAISHSLKIVKVFDKDHFAGFFMYTVINSRMKIIYHFIEEEKYNLMINAVAMLATKNRIEYLTVLDPLIARLFKRKNKCFAFSKSCTSHIYTSLDVSNENNSIIFDGDGDNCFT
jgi:GNAT superfamily N-acetyltransferase